MAEIEINAGLVQRIVELFLKGNLSLMLIVLALLAGAAALWVTPREEEPQIVVPLADIMVQVPGASAREVERQVATRLEKLLYQIDGVEYVYSMSRANEAVVTVRFYVGEDREQALVRLHNKLAMNEDQVPPTVSGWVVKPVEMDDVPIVAVTLYATDGRYGDVELRRIAEELELHLQRVANSGRTYLYGGRAMRARVAIDPQLLASRGVTLADVQRALRGANVTLPVGSLDQLDRQIVVEAGVALKRVEEVGDLVIAVTQGRPVYLRDVAHVALEPAEVTTYTRFGFGPAAERRAGAREAEATGGDYPAVTVAVAKKKGSNAVWVSRAVQRELARVAPVLLPAGVRYEITRDYGQTANDKVNELVEALAVAIVIVIALIAMALGWREALIVATAVPITFALTLLVNYLAGYTINRVTLFALILALGLVVDDPIVDVENIYRHFKMKLRKPMDAVLAAVNEVRPPIILATLAVIVSFIPMFFITGMMGPYMRPMALNVPLAMLMSLVVAFTITPWMSYYVLRGEAEKAEKDKAFVLHESRTYRIYAAIERPLLERRAWAWGLIGGTVLLFVLSCGLVVTRRVPLKMLPYDNKDEFQLVLDMPEGTTLERTAAAAGALAAYLRTVNEVTDVTSYVGLASPMDFNGMVRHYYLRQGSNVADLRVNLLEKDHRAQQSHEMTLRLRDELHAIAGRYGGNLKVVESPPGPPVISTLAVEVYGQPFHDYAEIQRAAAVVQARFQEQRGVVDVDSTIEAQQRKLVFVTDKEKAALAGLSTADVASALAGLVDGAQVTTLHAENEVNPLPIEVRLPRRERSDAQQLENLYLAVPGVAGAMIQLGELGGFEEATREQTIYHKNLRPVVYVFGETAGVTPAEAIFAMSGDLKPGEGRVPAGYELKWSGEGEWKITVDVFRDLGIAFAAACLGIYVLLVYETGSYFIPIVLMIAIPLTIIGIMPGFWILNVMGDVPIGGYDNPVFFTATAMIGMIALSGIATRNAILLIDFVHAAQARGEALKQAILDSGAVRFRPILLTAGTAMLAAAPITLDPIFSGLAWALIFGLFVSTAFTLVLIPLVYWMLYRKKLGA